MAIIHFVFCNRNVWNLGRKLNYINILKPVYFNEFLHGIFLKGNIKLKYYLDKSILSMNENK